MSSTTTLTFSQKLLFSILKSTQKEELFPIIKNFEKKPEILKRILPLLPRDTTNKIVQCLIEQIFSAEEESVEEESAEEESPEEESDEEESDEEESVEEESDEEESAEKEPPKKEPAEEEPAEEEPVVSCWAAEEEPAEEEPVVSCWAGVVSHDSKKPAPHSHRVSRHSGCTKCGEQVKVYNGKPNDYCSGCYNKTKPECRMKGCKNKCNSYTDYNGDLCYNPTCKKCWENRPFCENCRNVQVGLNPFTEEFNPLCGFCHNGS